LGDSSPNLQGRVAIHDDAVASGHVGIDDLFRVDRR
jgi:hypothetical protein